MSAAMPLVVLDGIRAVADALGLEGGVVVGLIVFAVGIYLARAKSKAGTAVGLFGNAAWYGIVGAFSIGAFAVVGALGGWLELSVSGMMGTADSAGGIAFELVRGAVEWLGEQLADSGVFGA